MRRGAAGANAGDQPASGAGGFSGCNVGGGTAGSSPTRWATNAVAAWSPPRRSPPAPIYSRSIPGLTLRQNDQAIIPRLGRPAYLTAPGSGNSAWCRSEFRPSDELHLFRHAVFEAERDFTAST